MFWLSSYFEVSISNVVKTFRNVAIGAVIFKQVKLVLSLNIRGRSMLSILFRRDETLPSFVMIILIPWLLEIN